jgi:hypothetical protein
VRDEAAEQAVLKYLQNGNDDDYRAFRSLTTLFEKVMKPTIPIDGGYEEDNEIDTKEELRVLLDGMVEDGLLEVQMGERDYERSYKLTEEGNYEASGFDQFVVDDEPQAPISTASFAFDSSTWTGIEARLATDPVITKAIKQHIRQIDELVEKSGLTNAERAKAKAITVALVSLIDSPEPEWKAIVQLLTSPTLTALLNVAQIVGLIFNMMGIAR